MKIAEKEHEKTISDKKNKLVAGTKEILVLFEEANGLWINLQGKDRKEQIEKYKSICENEGKEYKEPTSVKSELKLHVSYEGWKKDDKRHSLVNNKLNNDKIQTVMLDSTEQTIEYNIDYNGSIFSGAYLEVEKSIE